MDKNEGSNLTEWVNERLHSLDTDSRWQPEAERAFQQFQTKERNARLHRRGWMAGAATVTVVCLVLVVLASTRVTVQQVWGILSDTDSEQVVAVPATRAEMENLRQPESALSPPVITEPPLRTSVQETTTRPEVIYRVEPQYPDEAKAARIEGTVVLRATIKTDGTITVTSVVRGLGYGLDEAATSALEQWRFKPATRDGNPVDNTLNIEINFNLK